MPRLSLYRSEKTNDYRFMDRTIREMFTVGATDLFVHKYLGVNNENPSVDNTQPQYDKLDPSNIQDLLFLENRDRKYDPNIYRLRGHYNVQNLDFDLSQFGLFLNNDILFITVHYNEMIDILGRKLMVGDVLELPHLTDFHPMNESIPIGLRRYYQITDCNFASEGFSATWYPHLWRVKCEPLVDSQEFADILQRPTNTDNYLGDWDKNKTYVPGYTVTFGDKVYTPLQDVPAGTPCTDTNYWKLEDSDNLKDLLTTYNKNIQINDAAIAEAIRLVPKSGYDRQQLYVVPTFNGQPASPVNIVVSGAGAPTPTRGTVTQIWSPGYVKGSLVIRIGASALKNMMDMTASGMTPIGKFFETVLELAEKAPDRTDSGSGPVHGDLVLAAKSFGPMSGPFGTSDNTFAFADEDIGKAGFKGKPSEQMDYLADCDPRFKFIARTTPQNFGYIDGYLTGDGTAPNGLPTGAGTSFPTDPKVGDYFLRTDYLPQLLFRWDGNIWVKISSNVRTDTGYADTNNQSQLNTFINNSNVTVLTNGTTIPEKQALSTILKIQPD
jgi:hypothetical protein